MADLTQKRQQLAEEAMKLLEKLLFADLLNAARENKLQNYEGYLSQQFQAMALLVFSKYNVSRENIEQNLALLPRFFEKTKIVAKSIANGTFKLQDVAANEDWAHVVTGVNPSFKAWKAGQGAYQLGDYTAYAAESVKKLLRFSTPDPRKPESTHMDSFKSLVEAEYKAVVKPKGPKP